MLVGDTLTGNPLVVEFVLFGQRIFFASFLWQFTLWVKMLDTLVTSISLDFDLGMKSDLRFFKEAEIMSAAIRDLGTDDSRRLFIDNNLTF